MKIKPHSLIQLPETLVLVRHAQSVGNIISRDERANHEIANHAYPLTPKGKRQTKLVSDVLRQEFGGGFFDSSFCSTFRRTKETLKIILGRSSVSLIEEDSRLDEKWDGIFHDLPNSFTLEKYSDQHNLRERAGYYHFRPPGGESGPDIEVRIRSFFQDVHLAQKKKVLICCHGSWLLFLRRLLQGWSVDEFHSRKKSDVPKNCSIYMYQKAEEGFYNLKIKNLEEIDEGDLA